MEKKNQYTPGPWMRISRGGTNRIFGGGYTVATIIKTSKADPETKRANARLIAAAPELLEACEMMKQVTKILGKGSGHIAVDAEFFALWNDAEIAASKAIAKAQTTGQDRVAEQAEA